MPQGTLKTGNSGRKSNHKWTELWFGKYKGKTLPQIVLVDPDYFFWAIERNLFKGPLKREAREIARKATRIKVRSKKPSEVENAIHPSVGKLAAGNVVPANEPLHEGASPTQRSDYFDLSFPRQLASYDKTGGQIIVTAIKYHVFGSSKVRLMRGRCEAFFDDDSNFG